MQGFGTRLVHTIETETTVPNLWVVETVDSISLANTLNKQLEKAGRKQNIFVQVNTSGEESM